MPHCAPPLLHHWSVPLVTVLGRFHFTLHKIKFMPVDSCTGLGGRKEGKNAEADSEAGSR